MEIPLEDEKAAVIPSTSPPHVEEEEAKPFEENQACEGEEEGEEVQEEGEEVQEEEK